MKCIFLPFLLISAGIFSAFQLISNQENTVEKAHGMIEHRIAGLYPLEVATLDERCRTRQCGKTTLVAIYRKRERTKDRKISQEIVYFVSNNPH